jgi:hypothetical protein
MEKQEFLEYESFNSDGKFTHIISIRKFKSPAMNSFWEQITFMNRKSGCRMAIDKNGVITFDGKFYIKVDEYFYDVDRTVIEKHVFIEEDKYDDRLILSGHKGLVGFNCSLIKSIVIESTENFE